MLTLNYHHLHQLPENIHSSATRRTDLMKRHSSNTDVHSINQEYSDPSAIDTQSILDKIKRMRVKEIKQQLEEVNISTTDCFEKEELIQRLYTYKLSSKKKEGNSYQNSNVSNNVDSNDNDDAFIRIPMDFHSLTTTPVKSNNSNDLYLRPSPGKFPSISITLPTKGNKKLNLLVDTACSGILLRPSIIQNLQLPKINTGVTMTAAGGTVTADNNSVCRLDCIQLNDKHQTILKDFIVVGQDIGSLPSILDGIVGLSFLERYFSVSFDFEFGELVLLKEKRKLTQFDNPMVYDVVAETLLTRSRMSVYIASVTLDGRGPVKMIVDTGAASTFLNWKGAKDMNIDRNHPLVSFNTEAIGVMGADNNALALTHRFVLKRRFNFQSGGKATTTVGMFAPGLDIVENGNTSGMNIDIGDLPVLETMRSEDVGGILGSDLLMRADVVHFSDLKDLSSLKLSFLMKREKE